MAANEYKNELKRGYKVIEIIYLLNENKQKCLEENATKYCRKDKSKNVSGKKYLIGQKENIKNAKIWQKNSTTEGK